MEPEMAEGHVIPDTYSTPPGSDRFVYRLLLRRRPWYVLWFTWLVVRKWCVARWGAFDFAEWSRAACSVWSFIEKCGARVHVGGIAHVRDVSGPAVFVANHMSTLETLITPPMVYPFKKPVFVVKRQLVSVPLFGIFLKNCITVDRKKASDDFRQVMAQGAEKISLGYSVIVFPQATRSVTFMPERFNTLGVKLAKRAGVPVIPLALKTDFWGTGRFIKDFGPLDPSAEVFFEFGPAMTVTGPGKAEHEKIVAFIAGRLEQWGRRCR